MHSPRTEQTQVVRVAAPLLALLLVSCGGGSTTPEPSTPGASSEASSAKSSPGPVAETTSQTRSECDATCEQLISKATLALDRARALKGADQARAALAKKAGHGFEQAWRACLLRVPDGTDRSCKGGPEVVANLVQAWEMTDDVAGRVFARLVALDPRWRTADPPVDESEARQSLDDLAKAGEQLAKSNAQAEGAAPALEAAVYAHLARNRADAANRAAVAYRRLFGHEHAENATLMAVAIAEHYNDARQGQAALGSLPRVAAPKNASAPRLQVLWGGARARGLLGQGNLVGAASEAQHVVEIWHQVQAPREAVGAAAPFPMLGRERVVSAVGAAHHVIAEKHARAVAKLSPPRYHGPATHEGVNAFLQGPVAKWAQQKQASIAEVTRAYAAIAEIPPVPPGRWIVTGHTRVGELNADLADQLLSLTLPGTLAQDDAERQAFERTLRASGTPVVAASRSAFESCVKLSEQYHLTDGEREYCQERLNGLPPADD
jgi:hypothetical protein